ncbi:THUMP domain-containing class I SAM-dependent RNA methyltransferase [Fusibacter ferrireducens]|uniref:Class I SAM-dependent RNA methyltransferase n=1 Tax=Fusibacter ferrireducens TaxID=2785058 RepID=A0ABR9ZYC2_9FIRM|nr:class I SAM-dependent RNA methyltransferase [Fusibacter ferrireducens]MBF4695471.1 class I SAM-dependent RNA methyltransferase [Fusibacter ferrireducens]
MKFKMIATAVFGMEAIVKKELEQLGFENITVENGRVMFDADERGIARANLWVRTAERIFIKVGEFKATTFESLFDQVHKIAWENYIPKNAKFPVNAKSVKSKLYSLSDIQSICKKSIVNRLSKVYQTQWFEETEEPYSILVGILNDVVTVSIDTSGSGLHRRGYREKGNEAPMKETLAAGLLSISRWQSKIPLIDPFCGSGTIIIEAAMMAKHIAPGLNRKFDSESWRLIPSSIWKEERKACYEAIKHDVDVVLQGYDLDPRSIRTAMDNAELAGVEDIVHFQVRDVKDFSTSYQYGYVVTNPPYGERLNEQEEVKQLYQLMGRVFAPYKTWSKYVITSYENFEREFGTKATKNRKLYNGRIKTYFYQYFGEKPPRPKRTTESIENSKNKS